MLQLVAIANIIASPVQTGSSGKFVCPFFIDITTSYRRMWNILSLKKYPIDFQLRIIFIMSLKYKPLSEYNLLTCKEFTF